MSPSARAPLARLLLGAAALGVCASGLELAWLKTSAAQGWTWTELGPAAGVEAALATLLLAGVGGALSAVLARRRKPVVLASAAQIALAIALVMACVARHPAASRPPTGTATGGQTVLLVTGDTLRLDHVSAWPDARVPGLTPNLEALAAEGLRFDDAAAPAPLTLPAHTSMLTGLLPVEHGLLDNGAVLRGDPAAVPALLGARGWRTAAFTGSSVVHGSHGLARWFQVYRDDLGPWPGRGDLLLFAWWDEIVHNEPRLVKERGDRTVGRTLGWLGELPSTASAFAWVHLYDPHAPHETHPELGAVPSARDSLPNPCAYANHPGAQRQELVGFMRAILRSSLRPDGCEKRDWTALYGRVDAYAREVRFLDAQVGALIAGLKAMGRWERTSLVFSADHGESLTEHGQWVSHQYVLYDTVIRVPVIVRPAGGAPPTAVAAPISTVQVAATLLQLAGVGSPASMAGPDLLAVAAGATGSPAQVATAPAQRRPGKRREDRPVQAAIRLDGRKVIVNSEGLPERYALTEDPGEQVSLQRAEEIERRTEAATRPGPRAALIPLEAARETRATGQLASETELAPFAELEARAQDLMQRTQQRGGAEGPDPQLPEDIRQSLEALGYLQ